jgi:GTP-binding protein Era
MMAHAMDALRDADVVCALIDVSEPTGGGDKYLLEMLGETPGRRLLALNKIDRVKKPELLPRMSRYAASGLFADIVPISARTGDGCDRLLDLLWEALPTGPPLFDPELLTIHPERFLAAERIREKVLELTGAELPFATAVALDRWEDEGQGLVRLYASILVERPGQKAILVGRGGQMIKAIGTAARLDLEKYLGQRVYLDLQVKLEPGWREDRGLLAALDRDVEVQLDGGAPSADREELDEADDAEY